MNLLNFSNTYPDEASCKAKSKPRKIGHIKMIVIDDLQAQTIDNQEKIKFRKKK
jgi:hypothetical protein